MSIKKPITTFATAKMSIKKPGFIIDIYYSREEVPGTAVQR